MSFLDGIRSFFSSKDAKLNPLRHQELIYLENELLRVEASLRTEIKELWRTFNDNQAKTLRLEKSRSMKFPVQEEPPKVSIIDRIKQRRR